MASSDTLRSVIDAGRSSKRLDELSSARVIGKIALQIHAAQQKVGAGKAVGPVTPSSIHFGKTGEATLELGETSALGYSAPEQTTGGTADRRSDVFSLGTVLWEVLTHQRLFDAMNDAAVRIAVQEREIVQPSEINANVPAELSAICMRALARNPTDRYQSLKSMAVEIEEFLEEAGYTDDDSKIASYLAKMQVAAKQGNISPSALEKSAKHAEVSESATTQPVEKVAKPARSPASDQPSDKPVEKQSEKSAAGTHPPPGLLKHPASPTVLGEPPKASGADIAAALASASSSGLTSATNGAAPPSSLPPASFVATAVGVPKLEDWQDGGAQQAHARPPAAAPVVPIDAAVTTAVTPVPQPPVLPSGSAAMRTDKATILASVAPPIKVSTVEAKHVEAKQSPPIIEDGKATLVDAKPPEIIVPKLVNGRLPDDAKPTLVDAKPPVEAPANNPNTAATLPVPSVQVAPELATTHPRPGSASDTTKRAESQSDAKRRLQSQSDASPHPAAAVSLGPGPRDSKDVLAGWGWGTDKHDLISPDALGSDDYDMPEPSSRKMLVKIIGIGMGAVTLIIILAFAFGGTNKKKPNAAAKQADITRPAVDQTPPPPAPTPQVAPPVATGSADVLPAAPEPTEADKAAAAKAEADRLAAEQEQAKQAEAASAAAAKQEAERLAAEAKRDEQASAELKKREAAQLAAEQAKAKKQQAAQAAADKAEAKKQAAARIAADKEAKRQEALRAAQAKKEAAKTAPQRAPKPEPKTTPKAETRVAKAEPKAEGKLDTETAYRVGLQQFARGDTSGALASLRTSLAGNPNYAPTWRGLGMVFEKMGEKDQARAAYKRYLQLAPGAGDADQIRGRLERLGT